MEHGRSRGLAGSIQTSRSELRGDDGFLPFRLHVTRYFQHQRTSRFFRQLLYGNRLQWRGNVHIRLFGRLELHSRHGLFFHTMVRVILQSIL